VTDLPDPPPPSSYTYDRGERRPIEILVFQVDPADLEEWLRVDHEVWTLGEAHTPGHDGIPFLSKEVWLNDERPGEVTIVFVWPDHAAWEAVDQPAFQRRLTDVFDRRFDRPYELVRAIHEEERKGIHRWSRFERS
jgi:uncharacterized protein (TIGR03792 family)